MSDIIKNKQEFFLTFLKAQSSSIIATGVDFFLTFFLTEVLNLWYMFSVCIGAFSGGCSHFFLGHYWVFPFKGIKKNQSIRYMLVWCLSFGLNVSGVYCFTRCLSVNYMVSKIIVAIFVGVFLNFYLQRKFVFKNA